jgi:hypothetical protein
VIKVVYCIVIINYDGKNVGLGNALVTSSISVSCKIKRNMVLVSQVLFNQLITKQIHSM